jgi:hypothetical protein
MPLSISYDGYHEYPATHPVPPVSSGRGEHPMSVESQRGNGPDGGTEAPRIRTGPTGTASGPPSAIVGAGGRVNGSTPRTDASGMPRQPAWPAGFDMSAMPAEYNTSVRPGVFADAHSGQKFIVHDGKAYAVAIDANGACRVTGPADPQGRSFYVVPAENGDWQFGDWTGLKGGGFGDAPDRAGITARVHGLQDHRQSLLHELDRAVSREAQFRQQLYELRARQDEVSRNVADLTSRLSALGGQPPGGSEGADAYRRHAPAEQVSRDLAQMRQQIDRLAADRSAIERELSQIAPELARVRARVDDIERELQQLQPLLQQNP